MRVFLQDSSRVTVHDMEPMIKVSMMVDGEESTSGYLLDKAKEATKEILMGSMEGTCHL